MKTKQSRHAIAFILLFLSEKPSYGFELLKDFESRLAFNPMDSAGIYRALKTLEKNELVESIWDTSGSGAARKIYSITEKGLLELELFKSDIELRKKNLDFFLKEYESVIKEKNRI